MASVIPKPNLPEVSMDWAKAITKLVAGHDDALPVMQEETARANASAGEATDNSSAAVEQASSIADESLRQPAAPQDVVYTNSQAYFTTAGIAAASLVLSWSPTVNDVTGNPIDVIQYEVWYKTALAPAKRYTSLTPPLGDAVPLLNPDDPAVVSNSVLPTVLVEGLDRNVLYSFTVRTKSVYGVWGPMSDPLDVTSAAMPPLLIAPSAPQLSSAMSTITVRWDGKLSDGTTAPLYAQYVQPYISTTQTGTYTAVGPTIQAAGNITISNQTPGTVRWIKLAITDMANSTSPLSTEASVTVTGVDLGSLGTDVSDAIDAANAAAAAAVATAGAATAAAAAAQTTANSATTIANGKNTVFYQTAAPSSTGRVNGDTWFDTDDANKIYKWASGAWSAAPLGNNAVSDLDAGKLNAGFIASDRIAANTISTRKLLVGNFDNLLEDPSFETNNTAVWSLATADVTNVTTTPYTGSRALRVKASTAAYVASVQQTAIPVQEGDSYVFGGWVRAEGAGTTLENGCQLGIQWSTTEFGTSTYIGVVGCPIATSTYLFFSGTIAVPPGAKFIRPAIGVTDTSGSTVYLFDDLVFYKKVPGSLIVEGTITADKIGAFQITAGKIAAGAVDTPEINAGAITADHLAADSVTAFAILAETITGDKIVGGTIETNHLSPAVGNELDIAANNTITLIAGEGGQIEQANARIDGTEGSIAAQQTYYSFGPTGAVISTPDSPFSLLLANDGISINYVDDSGPRVVSSWDSTTMRVDSFVGKDVVLANHQLQTFGTGTVVRAL